MQSSQNSSKPVSKPTSAPTPKPKAHSEHKTSKAVVWRLKKGFEKRLRSGHPWVYSNELQESPKGIAPGALIEIQDAGGKFMAYGFGNPGSLIAFRVLSRNQEEWASGIDQLVSKRLESAHSLRKSLGMTRFSHRLFFGESDGIPGLIIDCYRTTPDHFYRQVYVVQLQTAGADQLSEVVIAQLGLLAKSEKGPTSIVVRRDSQSRKKEGLECSDAQVISASETDAPKHRLNELKILVLPVLEDPSQAKPLEFQVDLLGGQKTGFFLDQFSNIELAARTFQTLATTGSPGNRAKQPFQILDLFSYVGQWSAQLTRALNQSVECTLVDSSAPALQKAKANAGHEGAGCTTLQADIIKDIKALDGKQFDLVVCDPPALIKSKKDIPVGKAAYFQLALDSLALTKVGGGIIFCSCSALLTEEDFAHALSRAVMRSGKQVRWVAKGSQSPDHPILAEFPEGRYLKCWMGIVS